MRIETERLLITDFAPDMAKAVHLNSLDEDTRRFVPDEVFETIEEARKTVKFLIGQYDSENGPFVHPILLKTGENIGYVQLVKFDKGWEIGYHVAKPYTENGYATEAVRAFLPVITKEKLLSEVYGICLSDNIASVRVMEKCGFEAVDEDCIDKHDYQGQDRPIRVFKWELPKQKPRIMGLANSITLVRILCSIAILFCPMFSVAFYSLYIAAGLTDIVDGWVARRTHTVSELGSKLDTIADITFVIACLIKLIPLMDIPAWLYVWIGIIALIKIINMVSGFVVQKQFVAVHSVMNKITGILLFVFPLTNSFIDLRFSAIVVCIIATFAAIQEGHFIRTKKTV